MLELWNTIFAGVTLVVFAVAAAAALAPHRASHAFRDRAKKARHLIDAA